MTDKPPAAPEDDKLPEAEADARFERLVGNLVNTPHTPHKLAPDVTRARRDSTRANNRQVRKLAAVLKSTNRTKA